MNSLLQELDRRLAPAHVVVDDGSTLHTWQDLREGVLQLAALLQSLGVSRVALHADNGVDWLLADLACQHAGMACIPLPLFFSEAQRSHVLAAAGVDAILTQMPELFAQSGQQARACPGVGLALLLRQPAQPAALPEGTGKVTFTSGSTGTPKGVCLSTQHQLRQAAALQQAVGLQAPRHLCVLPLGVLLENVAGVYAPLLAGGTVLLRPLQNLGFEGSSLRHPERFLQALQELQPDSLILIPQLLQVLVHAAASGWQPPAFRFIAVGGARVAASLISAARRLGLPVYEGYGLSECASVVSLNTPADDRPGTCGRPLPHVQLEQRDGEFVIHGNLMLGYLGAAASWYPREFATGDLGCIDGDGFVHIEGRRKNLLISSYGRNIAPEWIESELLATMLFRDAVVVGEALPWCSALLYPVNGELGTTQIQQAIDRINARLPDYARIKSWLRLAQPLAATPELLTPNGRPRRTAINQHYQQQIAALYPESRYRSEALAQEARA
ncbi:MAG: AMP-binding protein [Pseudohongiellaceae bacterium]